MDPINMNLLPGDIQCAEIWVRIWQQMESVKFPLKTGPSGTAATRITKFSFRVTTGYVTTDVSNGGIIVSRLAKTACRGQLATNSYAVRSSSRSPWVAKPSKIGNRLLLGFFSVIMMVTAGCDVGETLVAQQPGIAAEGLWRYVDLTTSDGQDLPLTGVFLIKDRVFLQQSIFDGEPFELQDAMAHAGPYVDTPLGMDLVAEQTISISPSRSSPLSFRRNTEHQLTVKRTGDFLSLTFGSGTIQTFERIGPGQGEVYTLQQGRLAFVDGYFILVTGNENGTVTGYGKFEKDNDIYFLKIIRWAETEDSVPTYYRDATIEAKFDGKSLILSDGRKFHIAS
jgi:hypothetical protein